VASTVRTTGTAAFPATSLRTAILGLGLGNSLEWYDWTLFGLLSAYIGPSFFPSADPVSATLDALAVFAVGFAARPLGGILLGTLADRFGRRGIMLLSVGIMSVTMLVTAVLPNHSVIGAWAGIVLIACRLLQGISTGIEAPLSTSYAVELVPAGREGRAAGTMSFCVNLGIMLASLMCFGISAAIGGTAMQTWGWRIPFAIGALLGLLVVYLRRSLPETLTSEERRQASTGTVWRGVGRHWLGLLAMVFVVGAAQAYNYAWTVGLPSLARSDFHEDPTSVFAVTTGVSAFMLVMSLLTGRLADRMRVSRTFLATRLLAIPAVFVMLLYTGHGIGGFTAVMLGGSVVLALNMTLYNLVATSLMPVASRVTGVALGYGVGVALFGGTASYLLVWLEQQHIYWLFAAYTAALSVISILLYIAARRFSGIYAGQ
jgi:MHS family alpha-ketoglutarate permease-like MFS transporter